MIKDEAAPASVGSRTSRAVETALDRAGPWLALALLILVASLLSPAFLQPRNLFNVLRRASPLGIAAIGQSFVILTGGIDLSVASVISLANVLGAALMIGNEDKPAVIIAAVLLIGALIGLTNGLLVSVRKMPPFIVTLGTMIVIQGVNLVYTKGSPYGTPHDWIKLIARARLDLIPVALLLFLGIMLMFVVLFRATPYGRRVEAVGGNFEAARLAGVNTSLIITSVYVISSMLSAVAGLVLLGYLGTADVWVGKGYELDSIAAVVVGGTTFSGGKGGPLGTLAGILIITILLNIVLLLDMPVSVQLIVKGAVIVASVALYTSRRALA